ncbi:MAG: hypothetical protein EXS16_19590 [Gemmataceae bacterium]|nr:hypothetical protein [Gemmataceae bacterium]
MLHIAFIIALSLGGADAPKMTTLAGTGERGFTGDGGPASKATLSEPFHCEADGKGNLYVAESMNHCIRKVDLKTGTITTVAGNGKKGYTGDGGKAIDATFNEPYAVVVDKADNLFIVDRLNAVVRKIDAKTGIITTLAGTGKKGYSGDGGPANKAAMVEPNDCILDSKGGLLIADVGDWRIRRVDLATGLMSTFAGTGRAKVKARTKLDRPDDGGQASKAVIVGARAVCVDGKGNTYICEREGSAIRKVDTKGIITTISGTGEWAYHGDGGDAKTAIFAGPKGIRCDADGHIYVVDCENHCIRKIDVQTSKIATIAGGQKGKAGDAGLATKAGMDRPHGCCADSSGVLYIADSNNHRVRMVRLR